jgi:hypothetical protein
MINMAKQLTEEQKARRAKREALKNMTPEQMEATLKEGFNKPEAKEETPKRTRKTTPKPEAKQEEVKEVIILSEESAETLEEKIEILKTKTFYKTSGHTWEISPNIQDLQYNGITEKREEIEYLLKSVNHWDYGRNKPLSFSEGKTEQWKGNGEIKIIPLKFKGHDEIQYGIFLIPNKEMSIKVLNKVTYPWDSKNGKSMAKSAGRDNREYTYQGITIIEIEKGEAIPLGMTTNGGKAINNYGSHWANIYKVHFPKSQYSDIKNFKEIYEIDTNNLLEFTALITVKGRNGGNILRQTDLAGLLGTQKIYNTGFLVG